MNSELLKVIKASRSWEFQWGTHDCCTLANEVCKATVGKDLIGDKQNEYNSKRSSLKMLRKHNVTVVSVLDSHFNQIGFSFTRDGDLVMIESPHGPALSVKVHGGVWCMGEHGAMMLKDFKVLQCWRVE